MRIRLMGIGCLLYEVVRHTPGGIATAMSIERIMMMFAAVGRHLIFHAYQTIDMMVVRNDRNHQHHHADEKQEINYVPFLFHPSAYERMQR